MTRTVDGQLAIIDQNYFPAYVALAQANIRSVEQLAYVRRLMLAIAERPDNATKLDDLRQRVASAGKASDEEIANARQHINRQIADPLDFDDNIALARLDDKIEGLAGGTAALRGGARQAARRRRGQNKPQASRLLAELDGWRDDFDRKIDAARSEMRRLAGAAIVGTRAYQRRVVADRLGTAGDRRPARHHRRRRRHPRPGAPGAPPAPGTAAVEGGAFDTVSRSRRATKSAG